MAVFDAFPIKITCDSIDFVTSFDFSEILGLVKDHRPVVFDVKMCHLEMRGAWSWNDKFRIN